MKPTAAAGPAPSSPAAGMWSLLGHARRPQLGALLRHPQARALYQDWWSRRDGAALPTLGALALNSRDGRDHLFVEQVVNIHPLTLKRHHMGQALQQAGAPGPGWRFQTDDHEALLSDLHAAHRRCLRLREPVAESVQVDTGDGSHSSFERLLLPCTHDCPSGLGLVGIAHWQQGLANAPASGQAAAPGGPVGPAPVGLASQIEGLSRAQIDALPFGVVRLDAAGAVLLYSRQEALLSGRGQRPVLGLNFFSEVAPCMNGPLVKGAIDAALQRGTLSAHFLHAGDFEDADRTLFIRALSASDGGLWLLVHRPRPGPAAGA